MFSLARVGLSRWTSGKSAVIVALGLALGVSAHAQKDAVTGSLLPEDPQTRQAAAVAASVVPPVQAAASFSSLAGEYSYGNGFDQSCTLELSADGRFIYKRCNCEQVIDQARGVAEIQDGHLKLNPDKPRKDWPRGTADVLVPIAWGQRLYLVPQDDLVGFSNHVNRGMEPVTRGNMGSYYLREGDWDRPATGKPELPSDWKNKLLDEPIRSQVAGKDPSGRWIINVGKDHRVYDNMELSAWTPDLQRFVTLRVTEAGKDTSAVEIIGAPSQTPILGWIVYSRVAPPTQPTPQPVAQPQQTLQPQSSPLPLLPQPQSFNPAP